MADDSAALVLSLEARFDKFEKAMKEATAVVEKQTKVIEDRFSQLTSVVSDKLGAIQGSLVNRLGIVGDLLSKLGPAGIAAAIGVGAVAFALEKAGEMAFEFGEKMKKLRDLSITTGLSTGDLQALGKATKDIGSSIDDVAPSIERFIRNWELLRQGQGDLRTQLLRVNAGLEQQLAAATSEAEAVQLLSEAFKGLSASQAQLLSRAAFGRASGTDTLRLFIKGFDLNELQTHMRAAGKIIENEVVVKTAEDFEKLVSKFKTLGSSVTTALSSMFAPQLLKQANEWLDWAKSFVDQFTRLRLGAEGASAALRLTVTPEPRVREIPIGEQAATSRERIAFLAAAATAEERLKDALLQSAAAVDANKRLGSDLVRVRNELKDAADRQAVSERSQLGIVTEIELNQKAVENIYRKRNEGIIRSDEEVAQAEALMIKRNREFIENQQVQLSRFPTLKRAVLDAQDLSKAFDQFATRSVDTFADAVVNAANGTKTLGVAFKEMTVSMLNDIAKLLIKAAALRALGTIFPGLGSTTPAPAPTSALPPARMAGGPVWTGQSFMVGERGPELFTPSRAGFITPNSALPRGGSEGVNIGGPVTSINIEGSADESTIAAMQQMLAARDKRFIADVASATRELRRRSVRT